MQVITDRVTYQTCIKWSVSTCANNVETMSERFISQVKSAVRETDDGHTSPKGFKNDRFGTVLLS